MKIKSKEKILKNKILIAFIIMILFLPVIKSETSYESFPELSKGDYFNYEIDEELYLDIDGGFIRDAEVIGNENKTFDKYVLKILGEEKITHRNKTYNCVIVENNWNTSVTYLLKEGTSDYDDDKITFSQYRTKKEWWLKSDQTVVKEENILRIRWNFISKGVSITEESEHYEKVTYLLVGKEISFPLEIGKGWTSEIEKRTNSTYKYRTNNDEWKKHSEEHTNNESLNIYVISGESIKVKAGTFDCLIIKIHNKNTDSYQLKYFTKSGFVTKIESYNPDNSLNNKLELSSYTMKNEIGNDDFNYELGNVDFNFKLILMVILIVALIIVVAIFIIKKKSSKK